MQKGKTLKQKFPSGDRDKAKAAIDKLYNSEAGFIIIANADTKQTFARFNNMDVQDVEGVLASMVPETENDILLKNTKII